MCYELGLGVGAWVANNYLCANSRLTSRITSRARGVTNIVFKMSCCPGAAGFERSNRRHAVHTAEVGVRVPGRHATTTQVQSSLHRDLLTIQQAFSCSRHFFCPFSVVADAIKKERASIGTYRFARTKTLDTVGLGRSVANFRSACLAPPR